tara:strand:- start:9 stop:194 length:186 start_codon:yes stop_codon:yes gene_type:complete
MKPKKQLSLFAQGIEDFVFSKKNYYKYNKYYDYKWGYEHAAQVLDGHRWYFKKMEKQNEQS